MDRPLFDEGSVGRPRLAVRNARGALVYMNVGPDAKRATAVFQIAAPWSWGRVGKVGSRHRTAGISAAVAGLYLPSISRHFRQLTFEL